MLTGGEGPHFCLLLPSRTPSQCPTPPTGWRAAAKGGDCGRKRRSHPGTDRYPIPHASAHSPSWTPTVRRLCEVRPMCLSAQNLFPSLSLTHTCALGLTPPPHAHIFSHTLDGSTGIFSRPRLSPDPHGRNPSGPRVATTELQTIWKDKQKTRRELPPD